MARKTRETKRKTCVVYCRTSSVNQKLDETIGAQIQRCKEIVARYDLELLNYGDNGDGWIIDDGIGGTLLEGRKFATFIDDLKARRVHPDALVVFSISRLSRVDLVSKDIEKLERSAQDASRIEAVLQGRNVEVIDEAGGHHPGSLPFRIASLMAAEEYRLIRSRTVSGKTRRLSEGHYIVGGRPPFGYKIDTIGDERRGKRTLVPCPINGPRFKRLIEWYIEGGVTHAAKMASEQGWPTSRADISLKGRKTKAWKASSVQQIIENVAVYLGEQVIVYDGVPHRIEYEPLVDHKTLARIERARKEKAIRRRAQFVTSGFLRCVCGGKAYASSDKNGKKWRYFKCARGCGSIRLNIIEEHFWTSAVCRLTQIALAEGDKRRSKNYDNELRELDARLKDVNKRISKLVDLAMDEQIDSDVFKEKNRELNDQKSAILAEIGRIKGEKEEEASKAAKELTLEAKLRGLLVRIAKGELNLDEKRQVVADMLMGERIVIKEWGPRRMPPRGGTGTSYDVTLGFPAFGTLPETSITVGEGHDVWSQMLGPHRVAGIKIDSSESSWRDALAEWIQRVKAGEDVAMEMKLDGVTDIHADVK